MLPAMSPALLGSCPHIVAPNPPRPPARTADHARDGQNGACMRMPGRRTLGVVAALVVVAAIVAVSIVRVRWTYVPPGWDRWFGFQQGNHGYYENYSVNDGGAIRRYGASAGDYSTDVLTRRAVSFIRQEHGPVFLYFAPYAPHAPATPAARD